MAPSSKSPLGEGANQPRPAARSTNDLSGSPRAAPPIRVGTSFEGRLDPSRLPSRTHPASLLESPTVNRLGARPAREASSGQGSLVGRLARWSRFSRARRRPGARVGPAGRTTRQCPSNRSRRGRRLRPGSPWAAWFSIPETGLRPRTVRQCPGLDRLNPRISSRCRTSSAGDRLLPRWTSPPRVFRFLYELCIRRHDSTLGHAQRSTSIAESN
jgi:hypothetical protein